MLKTITSPSKRQKSAPSDACRDKATALAIEPTAPTWIELYRATRAMVCPLLNAVHERLVDEGNAESAYHLSALAIEILKCLDLENDSALTPEDGAIYRVHALIRSAMSTSGEVLDDVSLALLTQAYVAVNAMMEAMTAEPTAVQMKAVEDALVSASALAADQNDASETLRFFTTARKALCVQSVHELSTWLSLVEREHKSEDFEDISSMVFNRIDLLASIVLSGVDDERETTAQLATRMAPDGFRYVTRGAA